jgi:hypothetical protein
MATDIIISYDKNTNETISVSDSTDYATLGVNISAINGIRYLFATYNSILNATTVASLLANTEYIVVSGTLTIQIDTFTQDNYYEGQSFVPYANLDISGQSCVVKQTGYYCLPNLTIPSVQITSVYTPSQIGEADTYFQDNFRYVRYEIFDKLDGANENGLHFVQGTKGDYIENSNGERYYVGQVYTVVVGDNDGYSAVGNAYPVKYLDTSTSAVWTDANATDIIKGYNDSLANGTYNVSEDFRANYIKAVTCLSMPYIQSFTGATYSASDIQNNLDYINSVLFDTNKNTRNA